ncbi:GNAT family N-acetyltransferase [Ruegeria sp. 2012CJ41-6]|uniref:GNAT family N-acetyltransferase n=1 Tax=Ruegeria spongiae TaxID=2942209 RepID=A0ABT0Q9D3_9RHOB|nr:GNAT family N-acetyltransferase [Ruegeria spongiae]MCL6285499.1 GNAT family N-acetyltransferase [Ruegeria spongiae]
MVTISIRRAEPSEAPLVGNLVHDLLDELSDEKGSSIDTVIEAADEALAESGVIALIASDGAKAIGVMMLNECFAIYAGGKFAEISELYVRPEYRSKGVAVDFLEHAQSLAIDRGWRRLEVGAPDQPRWHRTLGFYLRNGFEEVGPRLRKLLS